MLIILLQKIRRRLLLYKERIRIFRIHLIHLIKYGYYSFSIERYNVYSEKKLCYIDIPKTASTSIKKLMIDVLGYDLEEYDIQNFHSRKFAKNHFINNGDYFSFSFTRNPYERLVSTYLNRYKGGEGITRTYDYYLFGLLQEDKGFEHFVKKIVQIPDWLAEDHFVSQYATLYDKNNKCKVDFVGKFENIAQDWKIVQDYTNLPELPHLNQSNLIDWTNFYTLETAQLVYQRYKKDFEYFGYDPNELLFLFEIKNLPPSPSDENLNEEQKQILLKRRLVSYKDYSYWFHKGRICTAKYKYLPSHKLGYLITYKTASSSILSVLLETQGIIANENVHNTADQHLPDKIDNPEDYFIFTFVRSPFERLVSCYQNKVIDEAHLPFNSFNTYLFGYLKQASSFSDFIERVCRIPSSMQEGHIRNQYDIIYDEQHQCRAHFIGKYENIEDDWKTIQQRYHLPNLPILNKTKKKDWRDFYTLESAQQVYHKYKKDIHTFNYLQEYENLITYLKSKNKECP